MGVVCSTTCHSASNNSIEHPQHPTPKEDEDREEEEEEEEENNIKFQGRVKNSRQQQQ
jgi:hypothetical protein